MCWGALTNFPCKLRLNFFFSALGRAVALGVQVYPLHRLATLMHTSHASGDFTCLNIYLTTWIKDHVDITIFRKFNLWRHHS